jgi:hypothetical protein
MLKFVRNAKIKNGNQVMVYNVHCFIHLAADVKRPSGMDDFSAFSFEIKIGQLKKLVQKPSQPMQQVAERPMRSPEIHDDPAAP